MRLSRLMSPRLISFIAPPWSHPLIPNSSRNFRSNVSPRINSDCVNSPSEFLSNDSCASVNTFCDSSSSESLPSRLTSAGFDTGGSDGVIGPDTRAAISGYQARAGLAVTGEPSLGLLAALG